MNEFDLIKIFSELAFPCIVTLIILLKIDKTLSNLNNNILELTGIIKSLSFSS